MTALSLPKRPKGRPRAAQNACFDLDLAAWCAGILEINSTLDFRISSRGWCYILEEKGGLLKGDFDVAQKRINACRKSGLLPLDICCDDDGRAADGLEYLDVADVEKMATHLFGYVAGAHRSYDPISFWETQPKYIEMATEKIDLKSLFSRECRPYHLPITNFSGWIDINSRAAMMKRFAYWETRGKECVLLYCGDHDPGGLHISEFICSNFADLTGAVGWSPEHLIIERFGLDYVSWRKASLGSKTWRRGAANTRSTTRAIRTISSPMCNPTCGSSAPGNARPTPLLRGLWRAGDYAAGQYSVISIRTQSGNMSGNSPMPAKSFVWRSGASWRRGRSHYDRAPIAP